MIQRTAGRVETAPGRRRRQRLKLERLRNLILRLSFIRLLDPRHRDLQQQYSQTGLYDSVSRFPIFQYLRLSTKRNPCNKTTALAS